MTTTTPKKPTTPIKQESIDIIRAMQEAVDSVFDADLSEATGQAVLSVRPRLNALVKRGLVAKEADKSPRTVIDSKTGQQVERMYVKYYLTEDGKNFVE